jgi:hypothetical protein
MRGIRVCVNVSLVAITVAMSGGAVAASEPTPDDVLKNKGLTRAGLVYVLDGEKGFLEGMAKIQPRYAEVEALYVKLAAIVRSQTEYDGLDREYALATERLRNVGAEIDAFPTTSNSELKEQYRNLLDLEKQLRFHRNELDRELNLRWKNLAPDWKREELFKDFQSKQQDFLTESRSLRGVAEDVKSQYAKLSRDDAVKKAIAAIRLSTKTRVDLGPSAEFKKKSILLKNAERTFSPETFRPGKTAKKSSRKNKADTSVGTNKRGEKPN